MIFKTFQRVSAFILAALVTTHPSMAGAVAVEEELARTQAALKKAEYAHAHDAREISDIEAQQSELQEKMVVLGKALARAETRQLDAEAKLLALEGREQEQTEAIARNRKAIGALTQALVQRRMAPNGGRVLLPDDVAKEVHTALALGGVTQALEARGREVRQRIAALHALRETLAKARAEAAAERESLAARREEMEEGLEERQTLYVRLHGENRKRLAEIETLRKKASSLGELIAGLPDPEPAPTRPTPPTRDPSATKRTLRSFEAAKGRLATPVAGRVTQRYRKGTDVRPSQQGMAFETSGNATIRALFDGQVVFAGPFPGYGRMVIVRHADAYHSLVSGLERINVQAGQYVLEGEPIGAMGSTGVGKARLYLELRRDNRPIDPEPWLTSS